MHQDGKEATHSGADHHCTAGGRGGSGPRQIREADQPGASRTHDGRALKLLTVLDEHTRECLAIVVARKIRSHDVLEVLADLFVRHGPPSLALGVSQNRTEYCSLTDAFLSWARKRKLASSSS